MAPKWKSPQLCVRFTNTAIPSSNKESSETLPFFLTTSGISGVVDTASLGTTFDSIEIKLDGTISICIPQRQRRTQYGVDSAAPFRRLTKRNIGLTQILKVGSATGKTSFPFHLDIINGNISYDRSRTASPIIPPTVYHKKVSSSPTSTQAETTEVTSSYTLIVCAVLNNTTVETISLPVRIYDNSHIQPPAYQTLAAPDHAHHQSTPLRRILLSKTGTFSATALTEPTPMVFTPQNDFATTSIPLQLTAETRTALSSLDASLTWRLRTSTIASILPMNTCPTMQQARKAPSSMTSTSSLGLEHEVKMQLKHFSHANGISSLRQDLAIALPKSALLVPTTHTEHISRRYSVQVEISVRGKDVGKASVCVEIPLQIGYQDASEVQAPRYQEHEEGTHVAKIQEQAAPLVGRNMPPPPAYTC